MPDEFVPLEAFLRPRKSEAIAAAVEPPVMGFAADCEDAIRAARRFRAGLADAVEIALARLLPQIAREVLARELRLDPADVAAIAAAALERFAAEKTLALRAHPSDAPALGDVRIPLVSDEALRRGDVVLELQSGSIDLRLDARLNAILGADA